MSDRPFEIHGAVGGWLFQAAITVAKSSDVPAAGEVVARPEGVEFDRQAFLNRILAERESIPLAVPASEALLRSAASRLYYEAFHKALIFAEANSLPLRGDARGSHDELIKRLHGHNPVLSKKMRSMREIRTHADYDLSTFFEPSRVDEARKRLTEIVGMLK